jgi:hypothetical protein
MTRGHTRNLLAVFSWHTTRWLPTIAGSCFARWTLSIFVSLRGVLSAGDVSCLLAYALLF